MSISIFIDNYQQAVQTELLKKFSPEYINRISNWYGSKNEDELWEEYNNNIAPVEQQFSIDLASANFRELWTLLNLEPEDSGEIKGYELIELKMKAEALLNTIKTVPEQFTVESEIIQEPGQATICRQGKDAEYWIRRLEKLISLIDMTDCIHWG